MIRRRNGPRSRAGNARSLQTPRIPGQTNSPYAQRVGLPAINENDYHYQHEDGWPRYTAQAIEFHLRNARAWANGKTGADLTGQIDPAFVLGPADPSCQR